jgi:hypothetical protein
MRVDRADDWRVSVVGHVGRHGVGCPGAMGLVVGMMGVLEGIGFVECSCIAVGIAWKDGMVLVDLYIIFSSRYSSLMSR